MNSHNRQQSQIARGMLKLVSINVVTDAEISISAFLATSRFDDTKIACVSALYQCVY